MPHYPVWIFPPFSFYFEYQHNNFFGNFDWFASRTQDHVPFLVSTVHDLEDLLNSFSAIDFFVIEDLQQSFFAGTN